MTKSGRQTLSDSISEAGKMFLLFFYILCCKLLFFKLYVSDREVGPVGILNK